MERIKIAAIFADQEALGGKEITVCSAIPEAVTAACDAAGETGMVCAVGSLYSVGAIRACFDLH